jgi:hypothetical protein
MTPNDFKAAFTSAEGWGTFQQRLNPQKAEYAIEMQWGHLSLKTISLDAPSVGNNVHVTLAGQVEKVTLARDGNRILITFERNADITAGKSLAISIR